MAGLIAEETIDRIRERLDIVEVVSSYIPLKRSGGNYQGLCPFHGEKSPSFNVNPARQIFHCFGCGVGGNAINFVMRMEGLSFPEAVRRMGERVGIEVEEDTPSVEQARLREKRTRLLRASEAATCAYERMLLRSPAGSAGRDYLKARGYDSETAKLFRLGYAPDAFDFLTQEMEKSGVSVADAEELGLLRKKDERRRFDLFRHRLIFPIQDEQGRVIAFGGRALGDAQPKYLNSPESPLYHKGRVLYGFFQAREAIRRKGEAVVVEGYFDLLALHRAGFTQSVATCGTALTPDQARLIKRMAQRVILLFDQDGAGQKANLRAMEVFLAEGVSPMMAALEAGDDPDSFLARCGAEAMKGRLLAARPALEVFIEQTLAHHGESIEGRARAVEAIVPKLRLLSSEVERNLYLKELARKTGIDEVVLQSGRVAKEAQPPHRPHKGTPAVPTALPPRRHDPQAEQAVKAQDMILLLLMRWPAVRQEVAKDRAEELFLDPQRAGIVRQTLAFGAGDEQIDAAALLARLADPEEQSILAKIVAREEQWIEDETTALESFKGCRQTILRYRLQLRSSELDELLRQAQSDGDQIRVNALNGEKMELSRRLKSGKSL